MLELNDIVGINLCSCHFVLLFFILSDWSIPNANYVHVTATTYKGKKPFIYKYSRVIHQKKCLLSLMTRQKSFLQNIEKRGSYGGKNPSKNPTFSNFYIVKVILAITSNVSKKKQKNKIRFEL